jgi:hypothetical protein
MDKKKATNGVVLSAIITSKEAKRKNRRGAPKPKRPPRGRR